MQTRKKSVTVKSGYRLKVKERLRESEINFVFCEWELFCPLATKQYTVLFLPNSRVNLEPRVSCALHNSLPRAKDGKRQKWQGLDVLAEEKCFKLIYIISLFLIHSLYPLITKTAYILIISKK